MFSWKKQVETHKLFHKCRHFDVTPHIIPRRIIFAICNLLPHKSAYKIFNHTFDILFWLKFSPTSWLVRTGPSCIDTVLLNLSVLKLWFCQIYQNCIVTDWQCIGTDWQTSRQSIPNSVTNPRMSWELEYYRDRPKCLNGGPFRLSVFTPAPILFCHSANIHRSANPMSIRQSIHNTDTMRSKDQCQ